MRLATATVLLAALSPVLSNLKSEISNPPPGFQSTLQDIARGSTGARGATGPDAASGFASADRETTQAHTIQPLGPARRVDFSASQIEGALAAIAASTAGNLLIVDCHGNYDHDTIQAAIDAAADGDVIVVLPNTCTELGHYYENLNFLGKAITVQSLLPTNPAVVDATIINGNQLARVVTFNNTEGPDSILDGLTITNGVGGIRCDGARPVIRYCNITANSASGMYFRGGAVYAHVGSSPQVLSCRLTNNSAASGGAIQFNASPQPAELLVSNCLIANNSAPSFGGGIALVGQTQATIRSCTIVGNASGTGGGIRALGSASPQTIENCIIAQNTATTGPNVHYAGISAPLTLTHCDLPDGQAALSGGGYFILGPGNILSDPLFVDPAAMNYHLSEESPCIDAGDPAAQVDPGAVDVDGQPRIQGCRVDIGADESAFFADCNETRVADTCEILDGVVADANGNFRPDSCEMEIYVDCTNCPGPGSGTIEDPFCSIQAGIDAALAGDQVVVAPSIACDGGAYFEAINFFGKPITVRSTAPEDPQIVADTIIDGRYFNSSVVTFEYGETTASVLDGLTIAGGSGTETEFIEMIGKSPPSSEFVPAGGGISCRGASPAIRRCTIRDNQAGYGGGILTMRSAAEVIDCEITRNVAQGFHTPCGGGCPPPSYYPRGAGVYSRGGAPKFRHCRVTRNVAVDSPGGSSSLASGGGILLHANEALLIGEDYIEAEISLCELRDNTVIVLDDGLDQTASLGGGIRTVITPASTLLLSDSLILENSAEFAGGAYLWGGLTVVRGCTIAGNMADGTWAGGVELAKGQFEFVNTIIHNNSLPNVRDSFDSQAAVSYSNIQLQGSAIIDGPGNINADPSFVNPAAGNYHLRPESPCIDAGDPEFEPDGGTDIDGDPRLLGKRVDMGADEFDADCNGNGVLDLEDIAMQLSEDCNGNGIADECLVAETDCNTNTVPDECDIAGGTSEDCTANGIPDECEVDCNANGRADTCDLADGTSPDCDADGVPDECELTGPVIVKQPVSQSVVEGETVSFHVGVDQGDVIYCWRKDGVVLVPPTAACTEFDAYLTIDDVTRDDEGVYDCLVSDSDGCTLSEGAVLTVLDSCPTDLSGDDQVDAADLAMLLKNWGPNLGHPADFNADGVINAYDLAALLMTWGVCP